MYLDNNNFMRRTGYRFIRVKGRQKYRKSYMIVNGLEIYGSYDEFLGELDSSKSLFFPNFIRKLYLHRHVKVVYTKLDLSQTNIQLKQNKKFKIFTGDEQIIKEYSND